MPGLDAMLGQDRAREIPRRALAAGRLPHAYLFDGAPGVGKKTMALALAQALNCERTPGAASCGCGPCEKIAQGLHPDVHVVSPGGAGNFIVIEQIRELLAALAFPPHEGKVRVIVLVDADRMNPQAQNAFLKTLEEPPQRTHIVLTSTAPDRLLVTIRSRCQRVRFAPLPVAAVAGILRAQGVPAPAAETAAALSGGSIERAAGLAEGEGEHLADRWGLARRIVVAARGDKGLKAVVEAAAAANDVEKEKKGELLPLLELLARFYRDAAVAAAGGEVTAMPLPGWSEELAAERARRTPGALARSGEKVLDTHTALLGFASAPVALEAMMVAIREAG